MKVFLDMFSEGYQKIKIPTEFPRKTRYPNPAVLKASEWRTISVAGFVHLATVFRDPRQARKRYFWLLQVTTAQSTSFVRHFKLMLKILQGFLIRSFVLPDEEYQVLRARVDVDLDQLVKSWEQTYQELYGVEEMTYNVHVFTHACLIRQKGPLPLLSAFPFEDHYSSFKKWYQDGTLNQPKQVGKGQALRLDLS